MSNFIPIREIKDQVSMVTFLSKLGFEPAGKSGKEKIYLSMLRNSDTEPSLTVDDQQGVWYDHGSGKGGDIIDFAVLYWNDLNFGKVLEKIMEVYNLPILNTPVLNPDKHRRPRTKAVKLPNYKIDDIKPLGTNQVITDYLLSRGVWGIANEQMREIYYYVEDEKKLRKNYFAIGWQNQYFSWEVRNKYFKGCLGKKSITRISADAKKLVVFEGYMNYLSWLRYHPGAPQTVIVLNSLVNLPNAIELAKRFSDINLYLDRDASGFAATKDFIKAIPYATDKSCEYEHHNDYNDKLRADLKTFGMLGHELDHDKTR
jgi:DNA primase